MERSGLSRTLATLLVAAILFFAPALAAEDPGAPDPSEEAARKASLTAINKILTDPVSGAWSIGLLQNNFRVTPRSGEGDRWNSTLAFQAALPIALTPDWDLITRPNIELFRSQPHPDLNDPKDFDRTTAFGDIVLLQLLSPSRQLTGPWLVGVGPTWIFPSGTSKWTSTGKWQVGPAAVLGYLSDQWILAAVFQNWRSFGGSGPVHTNAMSLQPIAAYFLPNGWSVAYSGSILGNWENRKKEVYTVPIGLQVGKVVLLGPIPVRFTLAGQWMAVHPEVYGQVWNVQLSLTALRPKLLRGTLSEPSSLRFRWEPDDPSPPASP